MNAHRNAIGDRRGFTLAEVLIAMTVFGVLIVASLGFMSVQNRAFHAGLDRMSGLQTARFALQILEEDVATAGTNVPAGQPPLAFANSNVIAFMADYVTNIDDDPFAVFYDPDAPAGQVSMTTTKAALPTVTFQFPDTTYRAGAAISPAELIIFYFEADTTTSRTDDYALYRKVNVATPELVARNLLRPASNAFFRYFKDNGVTVDSFPTSNNLRHIARLHRSPADTGWSAKLDSVRAVRVTLRATNGLTGANEEIAELSRIIPIKNVAIEVVQACGSRPLLGQTLSRADTTKPDGSHAVKLSWNRATDETAGEQDVMRYVIWRRGPGTTTWDDPFLSIPAGEASYTFLDETVQPDSTYTYGLAAQDCTPSLSAVTAAAAITMGTW
jgi:prepilin-type N-terminal cleavage/methylation domain-containing protein